MTDLGRWLAADFGLAPAALAPVGLGADAGAEVWQAHTDDGARWAVKWSTGGTGGLLVAAALAEGGVAGVPAPRRTLDGTLWSERGGRRLSVAPWVSDRRALDVGLDAGQWRALGRLLAGVHAAQPPASVRAELVAALPEERHEHGAMARLLEQVVVLAKGAPADEVAEQALAAWAGARDVVVEVLARADALAPRVRARRAPSVICHADPHPGNVLLDRDDGVWLIDWDDAVLAPRERDLFFVRDGGVFGWTPESDQQQEWFLSGYGVAAGEVDEERLTYYRCVRALEDVLDVAQQALDPSSGDLAGRRWALEVLQDLVAPDGFVTRTGRANGRSHPDG